MREKSFDLNLLSLASTLDETRSVTRAAQKLGMSQPGLSTALARLRRQFDDPMFVRTSTGMRPTPRGLAVAEEARAILQRLHDKVLDKPHFDPARTQTQFSLAVPDVGEMLMLPMLYPRMNRLAPNAVIQTQSLEPHLLEGMLGQGSIDLAIGYYPDLKSTSLFKQRLVMHGFCCMMRKGHPAAKRLTKALFSELEHVVVENATRSQEMADNYLDKRKIHRKVRIRTANYLSLPMIVTSSDLVATVPTAAGQIFAAMAKVQLVELPYSMPQYAVQQYWHRRFDNDPRSQWLRQQVRDMFTRQPAWQA